MIYIRLKGGLGNQLFEYAAARYLQCKLKSEELVLDISEYNSDTLRKFSLDNFQIAPFKKQDINRRKPYIKNWHVMILYQIDVLVNKQDTIQKRILFEKILKYPIQSIGIVKNSFSNDRYSRILLRNKNIYMSGYFQAEDFFPEFHQILKKDLRIKKPLVGEKKVFLEKIINSNAVCIHIRLGDYKRNKLHMVCTKKYYLQSVKVMKERYPDAVFFVFSDEIEVVKEECGFEEKFYYEPIGCKDYETLELMRSCKHFIMSNSSLSWWAQYLSTNIFKTVIAPDVWFNDSAYPTRMYQEGWIVLPVR